MTVVPSADPIKAGLRAWATGDLAGLEAVPAFDVTLVAVQPGSWDCVGPVDPEGPEPFPHGTRLTVVGGLVTTMRQYRTDNAPV